MHDHRELDLFDTDPLIGTGLCLWGEVLRIEPGRALSVYRR